MVPDRSEELVAQCTLISGYFVTFSGVFDQQFALRTIFTQTVGITALNGVTNGIQHSLHGHLSLMLKIDCGICIARCLAAVIGAVHAMFVFDVRVTFTAQIVVLANGAMVANVTRLSTGVAGEDELVGGRGVQFNQRGHRREFRAPQRGEFTMFFTGEIQKGVTRLHQIALDQRVRVGGRGWIGEWIA